MKTFTFLVNANDKHCFVHQYQSEMPTNDLFRELVHDTSHISSKMKSLLIRESLECYHDNGPVKLDCVKNVWRDFFLTKVSHPLKHQLFSFSFVCLPPYPLTVNTCLTEVMQTIHILRPIFPTLQPLQGFCSSLCRFR